MSTNVQNTYAHTEEAKYIISVNEKLLEDNKTLNVEITDKKNKIDELENELDSRETQVRYMRGLLKNFVAIDAERVKISRYQSEIDANRTIFINQLNLFYLQYNKVNKYMIIYNFLVYTLFVCGISFTWFTSLWLANFIVTYWYRQGHENVYVKYEKTLNLVNGKKRDVNVASQELKKILKGCDFLNEYIDNI
jgi:hypothetical protein